MNRTITSRSGLITLILASLAVALAGVPASAAPKKDEKPEQKEADRHFKSGVALFKEGKFGEALAEFERAYEIAPHPTVLYNIAGCHRELSHYGEAVKYYRRFLEEGKGKVPAARLTTAQQELDAILARIARVTVAIEPAYGATLSLDGTTLTTLDMPLIVPPGEHKLVAHAQGRKDAEKTVHVASGDEVEVKLTLEAMPVDTTKVPMIIAPTPTTPVEVPRPTRRFSIGAAFGTNLRQVDETGAPSLSLGVAINSRIELGLEAIVVAYAVMPSVRVRIAGDKVALHAAVAAPISFTDGGMSETFAAGAVGLGVRFRATPMLAFRIESFASIAGKAHGTTFPAFLGGELWF